MTSKILLPSLRRENLKHRLGIVLAVFGLFFLYMLSFAINVQNICSLEGESFKESLESITALSEPGMEVGMLVILCSVLLAATGFRYLHSKTEIDFYHSLPVRRRVRFYLILTNDAGVFFIVIAAVSLLKCAIVSAAGYFSVTFAVNTLWSAVCYGVVFLVSYLTMALAMIMTGNTFTGVLGYLVFASYFPLMIGNMYPYLAQSFFKTYCDYEAESRVFSYLSPVSLASGLFEEEAGWVWKNHTDYLAANIICIVLLTVLDLWLFQRRASEKAGKAMAFPKANPVIRILLVIPSAIYSGMFLYGVSYTSFKPWIVTGMLIGGVLTHGIIECIYRFDIRGLWSYKRQLLASMAASFLIVGFFWFDVSGFDKFLPKEENLSSILIDNPGVADDSTFWGKERTGITGDTMKAAYSVIEKIVAQNDENAEISNNRSAKGSTELSSYIIRYRMKDGSEKKRKYLLNEEHADELMGQVFDSEEYQRDTYSLYSADWSNVTQVEVCCPVMCENLDFTKEQRAELFRTYLEEHAKLDYETAKAILPFGQLMVTYRRAGGALNTQRGMLMKSYEAEGTDCYYLYPSFKKTIRYLKEELGVEVNTSMKDFEITQLEVTTYEDGSDGLSSFTIKDRKFIDSVKSKLVYGDYLWTAGAAAAIDSSCDISGAVKTEGGEESVILCTDRETAEKIKKYKK
jgi:hypothetical protein